ncbi:hypothetical protein ACFE04_025643 [Oxalis oulophora]
MENNSALLSVNEIAVSAADMPVRRNVRRRLVQATLFPLKSPTTIVINGDLKNDKDVNEEELEELCGSQGKKRNKRKTASTPPRTRNVSKKVKDKPANSTPNKNGSSNGKIANNSVVIEDASPPPVIPNLRLESKLTAEENSRMFAGKQVHPFFSLWKTGKKNVEVTEGENNNQCTLAREPRSTTIGPIHVFETIQDEPGSLNWGNWIFCERTLSDNGLVEGKTVSSHFECSFKSQSFNNISCASSLQNKLPLDQCEIQLEDSPQSSPTSCTTLIGMSQDCLLDNAPSCDAGGKLEDELPRMVPNCLGSSNEPENSLWTVKYQPNKAAEVCGNNESVKFMSEWLHSWHSGGVQANKDSTVSKKRKIKDEDYIYCESDPDSDYGDEGASLKNILLVTGPVGSGKSAAIYACAKEHGFRVFECNASECRNGAMLKLKLGEVLESHCLVGSRENPVDSQSKLILKSSQAQRNDKALQECGIEIIELMSTSAKGNSCVKPLILFEDVDITFSEDRGFTNSMIQIAEKAKGPVIFTCNSENPVLPDNLDMLDVHFTMPSIKELLGYLSIIGATEKADIQPHSMEQFIECCKGDIRKAIMHLQFWCQGRGSKKDKKVQKACDSFIFDFEVGHRLLPKIIPWAAPSQLSEFVDMEISKSLCMMEQSSISTDIVKELDNEETLNDWEVLDDEIEAKKEAMLRINGCIDSSTAEFDFCDPLDSPVAQNKSRRKLAIIMSSDSEDDLVNNVVPNETNNELYLEEDTRLVSHCPNSQNCSYALNDEQLYSEVKLEVHSCKFSETEHDMQLESVCKSMDVSCVPESSFVPETEIDNGAEILSGMVSCCGRFAETMETSVNNVFEPKFSVDTINNPESSMLRRHKSSELLGNTLNMIPESSNGEEIDSSENQLTNTFTKGYQVMDECSRMDFSWKSKSIEEHESWVPPSLIQESWRKLYDTRTDLKQFITSEEKKVPRALNLAFGMSNVISEADLLLSRSQMLDFLEHATAPCEESKVLSRHEEQLQMISTIAENGIFLYAKEIPATNLDMSLSCERSNLTEELLASTANKVAYAKLIGQDEGILMSSDARHSSDDPPKIQVSLKSKMRSDIFDTINTIVPPRSCLALKGIAYHEYLSSLGCMSRSETLRVSGGCQNRTKRRGRVARHYLSTLLSPEDISILDLYDLGKMCLSETNKHNLENRTS